jgi:hypothetical protein
MSFKNLVLLASITLVCGAVSAQKNNKASNDNRFANDTKYSKYLYKRRVPLNAKQSISVGLDELYTHKRISVGVERIIKASLISITGSTAYGSDGFLSLKRFGAQTKNLLPFSQGLTATTIKEKYGVTLGYYLRAPSYISTTGPYSGLIGFLNDNQVGYNGFTNNFTRIGASYLFGYRLIFLQGLGIDLRTSVGIQRVKFGTTSSADQYSGVAGSGINYNFTTRLFYAF